MAIALTLIRALFGRSVIGTHGLAWAVALHAALDVAALSAVLPRQG